MENVETTEKLEWTEPTLKVMDIEETALGTTGEVDTDIFGSILS